MEVKLESNNLKLVPTKLIRRIAPELLSRTNELQKLSTWRRSLTKRRRKLEALELSIHQMKADLSDEEKDWEAEADRLANAPFHEMEEVISIAENDSAKRRASEASEEEEREQEA